MAETASGVRAAIEQDRAELADTVEALVHKTDVKERVRESVADKTEDLRHKAEQVGDTLRSATPKRAQDAFDAAAGSVKQQPKPFAVAGVLFGGVVLAMLISRGRRNRRR